jgi:arylsulfatase A-like enzyme
MSKTNVFFLMCDELRADALGCMGNPTVRTPYLDAFSRDCALFMNAYTACPMCAPARVSLATGRYPLSHGVLDNQFAPVADEQPLYQTMREHGYHTVCCGKLHTYMEGEWSGFDRMVGPGPSGNAANRGKKGGQMAPPNPSRYKKNEGDISLFIYGSSLMPPEETRDSRLTEAYIGQLEEIKERDEPVFLKLSMGDPHTPYMPSEPYASMYDPMTVDRPPSLCHSLQGKPVTHRYFHKVRGFDRLTEDDFRRSKASYYGLVTHVDDRIGKVIAKLKELDLYDDALIVFTSDHGSMMGEHGFVEKWGHMYEPVVRIPLMIKFPQSQHKGERYDTFVEIVDIMPTVLDCVNVPVPERVQGKSLMPMLRSGGQLHKTEVYSEYFCGSVHAEPALMIRDRKWKLAVYPEQQSIHENLYNDHYLKYTDFFNELVEGELYDMENDPYEMKNLFDHPDYRDIQTTLLGKLADWRRSLGPLADYRPLFEPVGQKVNHYQLLQADNRRKIHRYFSKEGTLTQCGRQQDNGVEQ